MTGLTTRSIRSTIPARTESIAPGFAFGRTGPGIAFTANIEAADVLDLGVGRLRGFRIRLRSEAFGPTDVVRVWYGPSGYLQLESHLQADAVDVFGQVVGRVIVDDKETLVFVQVPQPAFVFEPKIGGRLGSADTTGGPGGDRR